MRIHRQTMPYIYFTAVIFAALCIQASVEMVSAGGSVLNRQQAMTRQAEQLSVDQQALAEVVQVFDSEFMPISLMQGAPSKYKLNELYLRPVGLEGVVQTFPEQLERRARPVFEVVNNTNIGLEKSFLFSRNAGDSYRIEGESFPDVMRAIAYYDNRLDVEFSGIELRLDNESKKPTALLSGFTLYLRAD